MGVNLRVASAASGKNEPEYALTLEQDGADVNLIASDANGVSRILLWITPEGTIELCEFAEGPPGFLMDGRSIKIGR